MKKNNDNIFINAAEGTLKVPSAVLRKCQACGKVADRKQMIRILTDSKTGEKIINPSSKQFGRSMYLCKDVSCINLAIKKKRLKFLSTEQLEELMKLAMDFLN